MKPRDEFPSLTNTFCLQHQSLYETSEYKLIVFDIRSDKYKKSWDAYAWVPYGKKWDSELRKMGKKWAIFDFDNIEKELKQSLFFALENVGVRSWDDINYIAIDDYCIDVKLIVKEWAPND